MSEYAIKLYINIYGREKNFTTPCFYFLQHKTVTERESVRVVLLASFLTTFKRGCSNIDFFPLFHSPNFSLRQAEKCFTISFFECLKLKFHENFFGIQKAIEYREYIDYS